jgi:HNH endonuclease
MLTQEYLKSILHYNPETGVFTWMERPELKGKAKMFNTKWAGKKAGSIHKKYRYITIRIGNKSYRSHRLAWLYVYGYMPIEIDHKDNIRHHNWIKNLRPATRSQNNQNRIKHNKNNQNKLLGVTFDNVNCKYRAQITINRKNIPIGRFNKPEEAHQAYLEAKRKLHPFGEL